MVLAWQRARQRSISFSPEISVVVPVFDERENLRPLVDEIRAALTPGHPAFEIVLVDDCSDDGSLATLRELRREDGRIRVVHLDRHGGQSAALAAGFRHARGNVVVTLDADLQNDPADIPRLLAALADADAVSGVRERRLDSFVRRVSSWIANAVRRTVLGDTIQDIGCALKAYRADCLREIPVFDGVHRFLPALIQAAGGRVVGVSVRHRPRRHGRSKYGIHDRLWRGLVDVWAVRWLKKRWIDRRAARLVEE